jgi:hypothetical protein
MRREFIRIQVINRLKMFLKNMTMTKNICLTAILGIALFASCSKEVEDVQYTPNVKIQFAGGGDSSIVIVPKGTMEHPVKIDVAGQGPVIRLFEIYNADPKTGNRGSLIAGTLEEFDNPKESHSVTLNVGNLTENRCIKVVVTDNSELVYEKNLLIKITPSVVFSSALKMETVENYYGPYFATWLSGRIYMRNTQYVNQIDFSLGDVVIPAVGTTPVAALVNPALRKENNLLTVAGLQSTKYELTAMTVAEYNAINNVNAAPITSLADPTQDVVQLQAGKVYLFKTANGKKGLINVTAVTPKTGAYEQANGEWKQGLPFFEVALTAKTAMP